MTKQEHPYAHVLRWIADGEKVQWTTKEDTKGQFWQEIEKTNDGVCVQLITCEVDCWKFRIKPRTIMIGDVECEAPIKELAKGDDCYLLNLPNEKLKRPARAFMHPNNIASALSNGMMFATPEAALAAGIAVSKLLTQE